jgi:hypothetical protein
MATKNATKTGKGKALKQAKKIEATKTLCCTGKHY